MYPKNLIFEKKIGPLPLLNLPLRYISCLNHEFAAGISAKTSYLELDMSIHIPLSHQITGSICCKMSHSDLKQKQEQRQKGCQK